MATNPQVRWEEVRPILGQQPTQQVAFAQYVVNIGSVRGGVINLGSPGERAADVISARPQPPQMLPRRVSGFVDRDQEQRTVGQALARDQVVDVHGPDGAGKTSLISQTMHTQIPGAFPDGMVYLSGRHQTRDDLLQRLFECFYETSGGRVKVNENEVRRYLAGKRALIALDDCNDLQQGDAEALSQAVPQSALIVAGRERQAWDGVSLALRGLPRSFALTLLQRLWGQPLEEESQAADAICAALGDMPLAIAKAVEMAAGRQVPLRQLLHEVQPQTAKAQAEPNPVSQAFFMLGRHLSEGERTVLSAIAAPGGDSVDKPAVIAISGLPASDVDRYLARLDKLELVQAEGGRYRLDEGLRPYVRHFGADEAMIARAAEYYFRMAGSLRAHSPDPDEENVIWALRYYAQQKQWSRVIDIVRSLEPYLATAGRWGQWRRRLNDALRAAQQIGDRATEAWAQNQLGVIALGAGDAAAARQFFQGALHIWREIGDKDGMTVARWNLQILLGPPPPPPRRAEPRPAPEGGASPIVAVLAGVAAVLVIGLGALAVIALGNGGTVTPPPPATTQAPPPPTTEIPPPQAWVDLTLIQGCDQTYAPGDALDIRVESNVDGVVDVFRRGPGGGRDRQFRQGVRPGQPAAASWNAPPREGQWVLEATLDDGRAVDECAFTVEVPVAPAVRVWLAGGCDDTYRPGTQEQVSYQASVDGELAIYLFDPQGQSSSLFSDQVAAGQSASRPWQLPAQEGDWVLHAELNDGQASWDCRFSVRLPPSPPTFGDHWAEWADPYETCPGDPINLYVEVFDDQRLARVELHSRPPGEGWTSVEMSQAGDTTYVQQAWAYEEPGLEYSFYAEDERGDWNETISYYFAAKPCYSIVYDFIASAADAEWYASTPYYTLTTSYSDTYPLEFPGSESDSGGFAQWRYDATLEDGSQAPGTVLETYPAWAEGGQIFGDYYLSSVPIYIQSGDVFVARVGLLQGAGAGDVTFELYFAPIYLSGQGYPSDIHASPLLQPSITLLGSMHDVYDGQVRDWTISLDSFAGQTGLFRLLVQAGDSASQDWATWVVARIERYGE